MIVKQNETNESMNINIGEVSFSPKRASSIERKNASQKANGLNNESDLGSIQILQKQNTYDTFNGGDSVSKKVVMAENMGVASPEFARRPKGVPPKS